MKRGVGIVFALAAAACGAPNEHEHCREHRCDAVALAFESTDPLVEEVVADLREATGADVITDPFGVPVIFMPEVVNPENGERLCGLTLNARVGGDILWQEIWIATDAREGCGSQWETVAHELIHVLAPDAKHTVEGLFAESVAHTTFFDRAAIATVCSAIDCQR